MPDLRRIADLCQRCIGVVSPGYFETRLTTDPTILPEGVFAEASDGLPVSTVTAHRFDLRFGEAVIGCGGIANVSTDPAHRRKGYARHLLGGAHALFDAHRLPVSLLSAGRPDYYRPSGYEIWERRETHLLSLDTPPATALLPPAGTTIRPVDLERDLAAITTLRESRDRHRVGALVRSPALDRAQRGWTMQYPFEDPGMAWIAAGPDGLPRAALRAAVDPADTGWAAVLEFSATDDAGPAVNALAARLVSSAWPKGVKAIRIPAADRDLEAALRPFAATAVEVPNTSLMLRIADVAGLLAALAPELEHRALAAGRRSGDLVLALGDQTARLTIRDHRVTVSPDADPSLPRATLGLDEWIRVVTGGGLFSAQPFARRSRLGEAELNLLDALFPRRDAVFHDADSF